MKEDRIEPAAYFDDKWRPELIVEHPDEYVPPGDECPAGGDHRWVEHDLSGDELPLGIARRTAWFCDGCGTEGPGHA